MINSQFLVHHRCQFDYQRKLDNHRHWLHIRPHFWKIEHLQIWCDEKVERSGGYWPAPWARGRHMALPLARRRASAAWFAPPPVHYLGHVGEPVQHGVHRLQIVGCHLVWHTVQVHNLYATQLTVAAVHLATQQLQHGGNGHKCKKCKYSKVTQSELHCCKYALNCVRNHKQLTLFAFIRDA